MASTFQNARVWMGTSEEIMETHASLFSSVVTPTSTCSVLDQEQTAYSLRVGTFACADLATLEGEIQLKAVFQRLLPPRRIPRMLRQIVIAPWEPMANNS